MRHEVLRVRPSIDKDKDISPATMDLHDRCPFLLEGIGHDADHLLPVFFIHRAREQGNAAPRKSPVPDEARHCEPRGMIFVGSAAREEDLCILRHRCRDVA